MSNAIGRFLTFEETLGKGLVKFAYFALLTVLAVMTIAAMIGAIGTMFGGDIWEGLGTFVLAPIWFAISVIVLRVLAELVLAVLSIDDSLAEGGRQDKGLPSLRRGSEEGPSSRPAPFAAPGARSGEGLTKTSLPHGDTEASRNENQRAPFADEPATPEAGLTKTKLPHGDSEAGHPANERAPFADERGGTAEAKAGAASGGTAGTAARADLKTSAEPSTNERTTPRPTKKATKKTAKKTTKKTAVSTKKTVNAANASPASARAAEDKTGEESKSAGEEKGADEKPGGSGEAS